MFGFDAHWQQLQIRKDDGSVFEIPAGKFPNNEGVA
jgi:hypothetical protein